MQQHTHPAWVLGLMAMPLALRTHLAGTTVGDAGFVDDAQAAVPLPTVLLGKEPLACWATDGPIWLEGKVLARVAPGFPGSPDDGRLIALRRRLLCLRRAESRSELGGAQRLRFEHMPQFQAQVPDPLGDHLPAFLSPGCVAAPSVGVEFAVFIGESWLESSAMQVQFDDIAGAECLLRQIREEEFIDDSRTCDTNLALLLGSLMPTGYAMR